VDVKKLRDLSGGGLYRLRVGAHRVLYAIITDDREILVLVVAEREAGHGRLMETAEARI
jgi:mRNA-degrading endonuclease RelE of RelBE toxin-antitoxin system